MSGTNQESKQNEIITMSDFFDFIQLPAIFWLSNLIGLAFMSNLDRDYDLNDTFCVYFVFR